MQTIKFRYTKIKSYLYVTALTVLLLASIPIMINAFLHGNLVNCTLLLLLDSILLLGAIFLVEKRLLPALNNETALELNRSGVVSYIQSVSVEWKEVNEIKLRKVKPYSFIYITRKPGTANTGHISIRLEWIEGINEEIFETVVQYFKSFASGTN